MTLERHVNNLCKGTCILCTIYGNDNRTPIFIFIREQNSFFKSLRYTQNFSWLLILSFASCQGRGDLAKNYRSHRHHGRDVCLVSWFECYRSHSSFFSWLHWLLSLSVHLAEGKKQLKEIDHSAVLAPTKLEAFSRRLLKEPVFTAVGCTFKSLYPYQWLFAMYT